MKLRIPHLLAVPGLLLLAGGVPQGNLQRGDYTQETRGEINQAAPPRHEPGAVYSVPYYPLHRPQLAPGEGKELVEAYCNTCHSTRYITMQPPLPAATWEAEVNKMIQTFGMAIPESDVPKIIKYLQTHYTPEGRGKRASGPGN